MTRPAADDRFYFRQLLNGRDLARHDQIAQQMVNFTYLIGDRATGECVAVDPAYAVAELVEIADADAMVITSALATHHHPDHVGGAAALARRLGIPVWAHAATAEHVARRGIAVARQLADGERIELAGTPPMTLLVHHTPGHARGHLALEVEGAGDLLGGDLVAGFSTIVIAPPEGDMDDYLASLERMRARGLRTLFPAHGAPLLEVDAALEAVLAHRLDRERQVLTAWRAGHHAAAEILPVVYADTPPLLHPLAERQIEAHLARLRKRGEITKTA